MDRGGDTTIHIVNEGIRFYLEDENVRNLDTETSFKEYGRFVANAFFVEYERGSQIDMFDDNFALFISAIALIHAIDARLFMEKFVHAFVFENHCGQWNAIDYIHIILQSYKSYIQANVR